MEGREDDVEDTIVISNGSTDAAQARDVGEDEGKAHIRTRPEGSPTNKSEDGSEPRDGGHDMELVNPDANLSLFLSDDDGPTIPNSQPLPEEDYLEGRDFAVVVPPVQRRWEYETLDLDPRVEAIIESVRVPKGLCYVAETKDGHDLTVTLEQLKLLPGGTRALRCFEGRSSRQSRDSDSSDSDVIMVSERSKQSRRTRAAGFVDISHIDFSDEDELNISRATSSRPVRKRVLLSAPKPPTNGRISYYDASSRANSSELELESDSDAPKRQKFSSRGRTLHPVRSTANDRPNYKEQLFDESITSDSDEIRLGKRKRGVQQNNRATRRSERTGRRLEKMRERGEDDISEIDTRTSSKAAQKAVGAKEVFRSLPRSSGFRLRHTAFCDSCNDYGDSTQKGPLIFCQGCTSSYHQSCLGPRNSREHLVTKVADNDFLLQCRRCIGFAKKKEATAPRQENCQICQEPGQSSKPFRERRTAREEQKERDDNGGEDPSAVVSPELINNVNNILFRCTICFQAFHLYHLPALADEIILINPDQDQIAANRFSEYCKNWSCKDCATAPGEIDTLVAWRPTNVDSYDPTLSTDDVAEDEKEYLVKWKEMSYYKSTWESGAWVWGVTQRSMRNAFARRDNGSNMAKMRTEDAIPEEYLRVDIVFEIVYTNVVSAHNEEIDLARVKEVEKARAKFKGLGYEDVVWEEPPDAGDVERWNDFKNAYEEWVHGQYVHLPNPQALGKHMTKVKSQNFETKIMMKEQPQSLTGGKLMDYQLEGINWLLYQWHGNHNAILADEMGLGKTIQVIGFLTALHHEHRCWPFLVVVPNSTCANWRREIKQWAPSLRVVTYFGSSEARKLAYKYELFPGKAKDLACHVVVTSYDAAQDPNVQGVFRRIPWAGLVVDEGQRLKNDKNLLYAALSSLKTPFKLLLTGTPLQNNQRELFNLLQFLDNSINAEELERKYEVLTKENVLELHELLRPFFLRRTKAEVLKFLPPMAQVIVPVSPSALQKQLYKSILARSPELLKSIFSSDSKAAPVKGLRNLLMQLRKCLCHPFVYSLAIEERTTNLAVSHRRLVEASTKLQLLEIMLPKLKDRGHRVLIFSQFLDMITIIEDFLDGLGLLHQRLDGTMGSLEKQKCIDEYNAPDSPLFALLLSTRAGGVGINLATADTVIILDPDFNPHQDIQAISRAHRIGQEKKVIIFQLMTRGTAEEKIMQIGKKKMALDHVLIEQMDADEADSNDLESVLRFGAEALFKDNDTSKDILYDSASVDKLLDRSQIEDTKAGKNNSAESQFSFARVWANDTGTLDEGLGSASDNDTYAPDPTVWEKILEERTRQSALDVSLAETLGRGKRQRRVIDYTKQITEGIDLDSPEKPKELSDSDTDFETREAAGSDEEESLPEDAENAAAEELQPSKSRQSRSAIIQQTSLLPKSGTFNRVRMYTPSPAPPASLAPAGELPCLACNYAQGYHPLGYCPIKLAGVEYCNLCGLAHYGINRACPHINSETQVNIMLRELKSSPEDRATVQAATKYLRGVKGDLVLKKKGGRAAAAARAAAHHAAQQAARRGGVHDSRLARCEPPRGHFHRKAQSTADFAPIPGLYSLSHMPPNGVYGPGSDGRPAPVYHNVVNGQPHNSLLGSSREYAMEL